MLGLGLLSTARINREILRAATSVDEVEVVAVASRSPERAEAYAREQGIPRAHGSYEALLEDPAVDAVYVSLPNALHHEWTMQALAAGKHVLCEKPYSRRPGDVEEAFDLAASSGLLLAEAFMYRHHPQTAVVRDLVAGGAIGPLRAIRASFAFRLEPGEDVRWSPELGGGALMDVGCYCVSGARLLAGEPVSVLGEQVVGETGVDLAFHGMLRFPADVVAQVDCSFATPRFQRLEAFGEEGELVVEAPWRVDWGGEVLLRRDGETTPVDVPEASAYALELVDFARTAAQGAPPLLGREDALGQARALDALYRAAESGAAVVL